MMILDGHVLDLDYTQTPTLEPVDTYFKTMWTQAALENDYVFQIKWIDRYTTFDTDGRMEDGAPFFTFSEIKNCLENMTCGG